MKTVYVFDTDRSFVGLFCFVVLNIYKRPDLTGTGSYCSPRMRFVSLF